MRLRRYLVPGFPKEALGEINRLRVSPLLGGAVVAEKVCFVNEYLFYVVEAEARAGANAGF